MDTVIICIIPPDPARTTLRRAMEYFSRRTGSRKALYLPPHITVVGRFKTERYDELITRLSDYCKNITPFILKMETVSSFSDRPMIYADVENEELSKMHNDIIEMVAELREPWSQDEMDKRERPEREAELLEKYGSPYVKEFYKPRLTLAGPDVDDRFEEVARDAKLLEPVAFSVQRIAILRRDERWYVSDEIPLG